ncbi:hypothetical protein P9199_14430 [Geobacillus stearothermophilus]|uniref:hypothetical protein n=1 Tax=Geobacillus stearothermophilus TaxID=1422 RepID=UPI002E2348D6|nr:hypothetical protein [Geobacillus stearothermophilus]
MLKTCLSTLNIYVKRGLRNPLQFLPLFLLMVYFIYEFIVFSPPTESAADPLQFSSFLITGGLLVYLYLGFYITEQVNTYNSHCLFQSSTLLSYLAGYTLYILLSILGFTLTNYMLLILFYVNKGLQFSSFYFESLYFMILNWAIPYFIAFLIGLLVGILLRGSKVSFIPLFIIWLFISPTNSYFLSEVISKIKILPPETIMSLLSISIDNPNKPYNALEGFNISIENWLFAFMLILLLVALIIINILVHKSPVIRLFFILPTIIIFVFFINHVGFLKEETPIKKFREERFVYDNSLSLSENYLNYQIFSYEIELTLNEKAKVKADMLIMSGTKKISLNLFHKFRVKSIYVENRKVSFDRKGDLLVIDLPHSALNKKIKVEIGYEGRFDGREFVHRNCYVLPSYISWLPTRGNHNMKRTFYNHYEFYPSQAAEKANFKLTYKGPEIDYTNLQQVSKNTYIGESVEGITIISGSLERFQSSNFTVYLPITWRPTFQKDGTMFLKQLTYTFEEIKKQMNSKAQLPKNIIFLPVESSFDGDLANQIAYNDDALIIYFRTDEQANLSDMFTYKAVALPYALFPAIVLKDIRNIYEQDPSLVYLFNLAFGRSFNAMHNIEEPPYFYDDFWFKQYREKLSISPVQKRVVDIVSKNFLSQDLLRDWYKGLQNDNFDWNKTYKLLAGVKNRDS